MNEDGGSKLEVMLGCKTKRMEEANGILSKIFRQILSDLGIIPMKWNKLMNDYLNDPKNRVPKDSRGKSSTRGNLNKELHKPDMTWSNFEKAIKFLNPIKAEFTIKLTWFGNKTTVHSINVGEGRKTIGKRD